MIKLHELAKINTNKAKRRGRGLGSGKGSKSGRGTTRHQAARTKIPLHFEGGQGRIVKRYPLLRGKARNKSTQSKPFTLRLSKLASIIDVDIINLSVLIEQSVVPSGTKSVKIVFDKPIEKAIKVQLAVSENASKAITTAGGSIVA